MRQRALILAAGLALLSCSHPVPPAGRWEGVYESDDTMLAARLEIEADGQVRVSAPDMLNFGTVSADDRAAMHGKLAADLAADWSDVAPRPMDFDGSIFRKPGGIAPQMMWKDKTQQMWLIVYIGTRPSFRVFLRKVGDFSDNPWSS